MQHPSESATLLLQATGEGLSQQLLLPGKEYPIPFQKKQPSVKSAFDCWLQRARTAIWHWQSFFTLIARVRASTIVALNAYVADNDEQAEQLFTSLIRMFVAVLTGAREPVRPPTPNTDEPEGMWQYPSVQQMLNYSFVGSKPTVLFEKYNYPFETCTNEAAKGLYLYE